VDRFWLLTWTTYGTWLPGDDRGFVSNVRDGAGPEVRHNDPGTPYDRGVPGLVRASREALKCAPLLLTAEQGEALLSQFRETAGHRGWALLAAAVMANHVHVVLGVPGDPEPSDLLRDFKSYGSRPLNRLWGKPPSGTWWTEGGSRRKLPDRGAVFNAVRYVRDQYKPLVVWLNTDAIRGHLDPTDADALLASGGRQPPDAVQDQGADAPARRSSSDVGTGRALLSTGMATPPVSAGHRRRLGRTNRRGQPLRFVLFRPANASVFRTSGRPHPSALSPTYP
jgi:REP element-mobilizing transposase RayT